MQLRVMQLRVLRLFTFAALSALLLLPATEGLAGSTDTSGSALVIPDGTEIRLRLKHPVSSATAQEEDAVILEAADDVIVDGEVVIAAGAEAYGRVTDARPRRGFGRRGKLDFTIDVVEAVNGANVPLRTERSLRGGDRYTKAGVVTLIAGPFGIFVKGKNVEVPAGAEYTLYLDGDFALR